MGDITPGFKASIFRFDQPIILSNPIGKRIIAGLVQYDSSNYEAGRVVARNTTTGFYQKYVDGVATGVGTAVGVLLEPVDFSAVTSGQQISRVCVGGSLFYDKLVGIDAAGITDLLARKVTDAAGVNLLIF